MFKDKEEALRRLEAELLQEEEEQEESEAWEEEDWEEDPEEAWDGDPDEEEEEDQDEEDEEDGPYEAPAHRYRVPHGRAYNADRVDEDLEEFSEKIYNADKRSRGRWIAAGVLIVLAAVLLVLAFLAARYGGSL